jgi:hypothetical protein
MMRNIWSHSRVEEAVRIISQRDQNFFLLGDSGYPLRKWLQTPIRDPVPNTPEYAYNEVFKRTCSVIERCNGVIKMRLRCLLKHRVLHYAPTSRARIINACVVLHNLCIDRNIPEPEHENGDDELNFGLFENANYREIEIPRMGQNQELMAGRNLQRRIINNYFNH